MDPTSKAIISITYQIQKTTSSDAYTTETIELDCPRIDLNKDSDLAAKKKILDFLIKCEREQQEYRYGEALETFKKFKKKYHVMLQCYHLFGIEAVIGLNYNQDAMKQKLIAHNNNISKMKITAELDSIYQINDNPDKAGIKEVLQGLYDKHEYLGKDGKVMNATASQLADFGFTIKTSKSELRNGSRKPSFKIEAKDFICTVAA